MKITSSHILWGIFIALLLVLLPHTAWFFAQFESQEVITIFGYEASFLNSFIPYAAAFAFEAAIAALVHRLAEHLEKAKVKPGNQPMWVRKVLARYANIYSLALLIVVSISSIANYAHAVEFGQPIKVFVQLGIPLAVYAVVAGAVLPFCSLLFARVLSNVIDTEQESDPEMERVKAQARDTERKYKEQAQDLTKQIQALSKQLDETNRKQAETEKKFGDYLGLLAEDKKTRVLTARAIWPDLAYSGLEVITGAKAGYISEVLNNNKPVVALNGHGKPAGNGAE